MAALVVAAVAAGASSLTGRLARGSTHVTERSTLAGRNKSLPLLQHAAAICWADSDYGLLDYTNSYGVDSLFAMTQLMMNAANDLRPLANGRPAVEAKAISQVRSALNEAAAAENQILIRTPPPPAVPQRLITAAAQAVTNLDKVAMRTELRTCEFTVNEATIDGWATLAPPPHA